MSNVVTIKQPRTLAHVLLEIQDAGPVCWGQREHQWAHMNDDQRSEALDRLDALRDEAKAMIEQLTGVSWDSIADACL